MKPKLRKVDERERPRLGNQLPAARAKRPQSGQVYFKPEFSTNTRKYTSPTPQRTKSSGM